MLGVFFVCCPAVPPFVVCKLYSLFCWALGSWSVPPFARSLLCSLGKYFSAGVLSAVPPFARSSFGSLVNTFLAGGREPGQSRRLQKDFDPCRYMKKAQESLPRRPVWTRHEWVWAYKKNPSIVFVKKSQAKLFSIYMHI